MSKSEKQKALMEPTEEVESEEENDSIENMSTTNAIASYRKIKEGKKELSDKELIILDKECKIIEEREIIAIDPIHEPVEIELTGKEPEQFLAMYDAIRDKTKDEKS